MPIRIYKAWACRNCEAKGHDRVTARIHANQAQHVVIFTEMLKPEGYKARGPSRRQMNGY